MGTFLVDISVLVIDRFSFSVATLSCNAVIDIEAMTSSVFDDVISLMSMLDA